MIRRVKLLFPEIIGARVSAAQLQVAVTLLIMMDQVALGAIPEPALLGLFGTSLLSAHLALRRRRRPSDCLAPQFGKRRQRLGLIYAYRNCSTSPSIG